MIDVYRLIEDRRSTFGVERMCRTLGVSRSGFYAWKRGVVSKRKQANQALLAEIKRIDKELGGIYGSPRMTVELRARGFVCSEKRVARLMRQANIKPVTSRKFKVTTNSDHSQPLAENLVDQNFHAERPNQLWTSDITYIETHEGWMYMAVVLDVFSRQIVGWALEKRMKKELVIKAINQALSVRKVKEGLIFHSDRGSQYASEAVRKILKDNKIRQSMSGVGNCYDNAITESFFATLKKEFIYPFEVFNSRKEAKSALFYYIEYVYNRVRRHSAIGFMSPVQYEKINQAA